MEKQRFEGHCQYCCNQQRLTSENKLVHHGFERPGDGAIHGDCDGVGELPIELDITLANEYLQQLQYDLYDLKGDVESTKTKLEELEKQLRLTMPVMENKYLEYMYLKDNQEYKEMDKLHSQYAGGVFPLEMFISKLEGTIERNHGKPVIDFMEAENRRKVELAQRPEKAKFGAWKYSKSRYEINAPIHISLEEYTEDSLRAFKRSNQDILNEIEESLKSHKGYRSMPKNKEKMMKDLETMLTYLGVK